MKRFVSLLFTTLVMINLAFGQTPTTIQGQVKDEDGRGIGNVKVMIVDLPTTTLTSEDGRFSLDPKREGTLKLIFSHPDYITKKREIHNSRHEATFINITLVLRNPILKTIRKEISVTAEADSIADLTLPSHKTILPESVLAELGTANITESMENVPGVAAVGKGGYSMSPSIRGLAEHRVLLLVDGVRITSERRIGPSASFVNLNTIERLEINRGPYSVFHGSGAIGGIVNIITKVPQPGKPMTGDFSLSYNTARKETAGSATLSGFLGKWGLMVSAAGKKADDYQSPGGTIHWSRYSDYNMMFKVNRQENNYRLFATLFHYKGTDIGKPSPSSYLKPRWYPDETNTFLMAGGSWKPDGVLDSLDARVFIFKASLDTRAENLDKTSLSTVEASLSQIKNTNIGFKLRAAKSLGKQHKINMGFDFFSQTGINDQNTTWYYSPEGKLYNVEEDISLNDASRSNYGFFLDDKINLNDRLEVNLGVRLDFLATRNHDPSQTNISVQDHFFSMYCGAIWQINQHISILGNVGRSFRFPTVSELYYTGLTGRGTVYGNPLLEPEKSINLDFGIRYIRNNLFAALYGFRNDLTDMIQKYAQTSDDEYYYRNLSGGRVTGIEGELYLELTRAVELFINFHHMKGMETDGDTPLNYIPPTRLALWGKISPGRWWVEPRLTFSWAKKDPGPLEISMDDFILWDVIFGLKINKHLKVMAVGQNLLNQAYRMSADEKGVDAPGRGWVLKIKYSL